MPIYRYSCSDCEAEFSVLELAGDPITQRCKQCSSKKIKRLPSVPGVQFKGKGFYVTDRKSGSSSAAKPSENGKSKGATTKSDTSSNADKAKKPDQTSKPAAS